MALTNFGNLNTNQLTTWSRDFWRVARNNSFINQFAGSGSNAMVQRITDLTKSEKGTKAIITLLADMAGDGITGDYTLEGSEEKLRAFDQTINIDQLRFANRKEGRLADQKVVVNFREQSRDALAYAIADRIDQMAFLTLAGLDYTQKTNRATRPVLSTGQNLGDLEFASDVTTPTNGRHLQVAASDTLTETNDTTAIDATHLLTYEVLVRLRAHAKDNFVRPIKSVGGVELYHLFVTPKQMASLKLDDSFLNNVRNAGVRGKSNQLFAGASSLMVDGIMVHEFRHVPNTDGLISGTDKWGSGATIDGGSALLCGAQALAMADIGLPTIEEDTFDYGNQHGISIGKIFGFKKPVFHSDVTGIDEDFGVIRLDTAV